MGKRGPKPGSGEFDVWISLKLRADQRESLDKFAALWHISRSEAVRWLIDYVPTLIGTPEAEHEQRV